MDLLKWGLVMRGFGEPGGGTTGGISRQILLKTPILLKTTGEALHAQAWYNHGQPRSKECMKREGEVTAHHQGSHHTSAHRSENTPPRQGVRNIGESAW